ncbi:MAG: hypothetical protein AAFR96_05145 [Planctomycetota bacterium]
MTTGATNETDAGTTAAFPDPSLPQVEMHVHRPNEPAEAVVVRTEICTNRKAAGFVRHIELDVSKTGLAGRFRAGQSFGVIPPGEDARGRPHSLRLYSIASPTAGEDGAGAVLATTVKRSIDEHWDDHSLFLGVASNHLCDLKPGDTVKVTGPNGKRFLLPQDRHDWSYLFFATGTGIAPFRGMLMDLFEADTQPPANATLVMGAPYRTDLLYDDALAEMDRRHGSMHYLTAISRETDPSAGRSLYVQDRLDTHPELIELLSADKALIYVCGIAGMELGIFRALARRLPADILPRFLSIDPEVASDPESWTRRMIHKQIKPTRRVFLEVY